MKPVALHISVLTASWIPRQAHTQLVILGSRAARHNGRTRDSLRRVRRIQAAESPSPID